MYKYLYTNIDTYVCVFIQKCSHQTTTTDSYRLLSTLKNYAGE